MSPTTRRRLTALAAAVLLAGGCSSSEAPESAPTAPATVAPDALDSLRDVDKQPASDLLRPTEDAGDG
jgi:hypothetical protein